MATILFDDTTEALILGEETVYETLASDNFIGGSAVAISSGSLRFTFSGIAVSLYGRRSDSSSPSTASTRSVPLPNIRDILMDGIPIESNVTFPYQVTIGLIYQLPQLSDAEHTLTFSNVSFVILDFIEVTAGSTTLLSGSTLLLNSGDSAISYKGNWTNNDTMLVDDAYQYRQPIGGATRDTSFGDASATVSFTGTSISVLGTRYSDPEVPFSPIFYVDGKRQPYQSPRRSGPNYPWFSSQQFSNGNHVLNIDLSGNTVGAHFSLEYITFTASSENLDTNSHQIPVSVFIGVGAGVGVVVGVLLLVVLVWWRRRTPKGQSSDTGTTTSTNAPELPRTAHQNRDPSLMNQPVRKSSLRAYPLTPHDFSMVGASTRQNVTSTSVDTRYAPAIDTHSTKVQRLSQDQQITDPLVPRPKRSREKELRQYIGPSRETQTSDLSTNSQIRRLQDMVQQFHRDIALPDLDTNSQNPSRDFGTDPSLEAVSRTSPGTRIPHNEHIAEGPYGMGVQELEELMRELREGTAHSELGQDQVGTGRSTTLVGLVEEILELQKNQSKGGERSPASHRNIL